MSAVMYYNRKAPTQALCQICARARRGEISHPACARARAGRVSIKGLSQVPAAPWCVYAHTNVQVLDVSCVCFARVNVKNLEKLERNLYVL